MASNIRDVAIHHITRDTKELILLKRAFEEGSNQQILLSNAIEQLQELLQIEGVKDEIN